MNYKYYQHNNEVIAVSTFAGKEIKGVAKCNPEDEFDLETGKKIAAARCNLKAAQKRLKRANEKWSKAYIDLFEANRRFEKMKQYYMDAVDALDEATVELAKMIE